MNIRKITPSLLLDKNQWRRFFYVLKESSLRRCHVDSVMEDELLWRFTPRHKEFSGNNHIRILFVALRYDYGSPKRGIGGEEYFLLDTLLNMGFEIIQFDFKTIEKKYSRKLMNEALVNAAYRYRPDLVFFALYTDEISKAAIQEISKEMVTFSWFADDHWRFDNFSRHYAPLFTWVTTTSQSAVKKYIENNIHNFIKTQWACNHFLYRKLKNIDKKYDVTFIGQPHGNRREIIKGLRKKGINVATWGYGWPTGRISQMEMIKIFNQSKINLNLSNASVKEIKQIKGRDFEVPGCGSFLLTEYMEELEEYFQIEKEIVCYSDITALPKLINYYLENETEREEIAAAGYKRVLSEHTYVHRFNEIFTQMGFEIDSPIT